MYGTERECHLKLGMSTRSKDGRVIKDKAYEKKKALIAPVECGAVWLPILSPPRPFPRSMEFGYDGNLWNSWLKSRIRLLLNGVHAVASKVTMSFRQRR